MTGRDDRVRPLTRGVALLVLPFLAVAVVLLYLLPDRTDELFAWTIAPPLTSMLLASAYVGGIWFFVRVLLARRWHRVKYGMPAVLVFASLLGVATLLHWDRFHHGHISFVAWAVLYLVTPLLVTAVLIANWRADPGTPEERDLRIPTAARAVLAVVGGAATLCGLCLFLLPEHGVQLWAWETTPLTTRVVGAVLTLPGAVNLWLLRETRWTAMREVVQAEIVSLVFIAVAVAVSAADLVWQRLAAPAFVGGIAVSLVGFSAFYLWCERRMRYSR
jgi:hypothetical protein